VHYRESIPPGISALGVLQNRKPFHRNIGCNDKVPKAGGRRVAGTAGKIPVL
jgi:hypothetical protein